jgi:quinol-cytochrome oxidoreductase complex cytochrome b subunit
MKRLEMNEVDGPINVTIELLELLICIREISVSILVPKNVHPRWCFLWFYESLDSNDMARLLKDDDHFITFYFYISAISQLRKYN